MFPKIGISRPLLASVNLQSMDLSNSSIQNPLKCPRKNIRLIRNVFSVTLLLYPSSWVFGFLTYCVLLMKCFFSLCVACVSCGVLLLKRNTQLRFLGEYSEKRAFI